MRKLKVLVFIILVVISIFFMGACGKVENVESKNSEEKLQKEEIAKEVEKKVDPALIKANEAGKIMILEWHVIGEKEGRWARTYSNFHKDLEVLYEKGYRLISLRDYVTNNIKVEPGFTPVVLTFDDGSEGHFRYLEKDGELIIDPNCAVGILKDFAEKHPDFGLEATFFINYYAPFGQKEYWQDKLKHLVELGMDLGNHTVNHPNLKKLSQEQVETELGKMVKLVTNIVPGYKLDTLALPHGISPENNAWAVKGRYKDIDYHNLAVLLVGAGPAKSPIATGFNPAKLPRIQVFQEEFDKWLNYFEKNPDQRYISDGNPDTICIPQEQEKNLDNEKIGDKEVIVYQH